LAERYATNSKPTKPTTAGIATMFPPSSLKLSDVERG
jgi:hypothetical protein